MSIMSAIALYGIMWFLTMFIVLPIRLKTQGDVGQIVPGTHASAPSEIQMWSKVKLTTLITTVAFVTVAVVIWSEIITFDMIESVTRGR
jgi:predicted secreted protein